jgi:hypothetical protein
MDDAEREAIRGEGFDPDDPVVRAAVDLVRWELELIGPGSRKPPRFRSQGGLSNHRKQDL